MGPPRDKRLDFFILAAELGGKHLLASGEVLFMGIKPNTEFPQPSIFYGSLTLRRHRARPLNRLPRKMLN